MFCWCNKFRASRGTYISPRFARLKSCWCWCRSFFFVAGWWAAFNWQWQFWWWCRSVGFMPSYVAWTALCLIVRCGRPGVITTWQSRNEHGVPIRCSVWYDCRLRSVRSNGSTCTYSVGLMILMDAVCPVCWPVSADPVWPSCRLLSDELILTRMLDCWCATDCPGRYNETAQYFQRGQ